MSEANNGAAGIGAADIAGADAADETVIRIEDLRKTFGDNEVLRGIDLDVRRGEVVVILGPSGSGKSTLLRCVNLLEKPTGGRIFFEDTEITAKKTDINKVRAKVGMVFQNFNLFPHLTAKKNVMLAQQKVLHRNKEEAARIAEEQLEKVGLGEMLKYWLTNLPAVIGLFAEIIRFVAQMTIQSMAMYVFTYAFGDVAMAAVMLTACNVTGLVATFVSEPVARKVGIRATYLVGIGVSFAFSVVCLFVGASSMMAFIVCICGIYFGMNFMNGTMMGMQSNAIAYGEWRDGKTAKAFIMSTFQWCPKIANAVAGLLTGFGLAAIGFVSGMEASPELAQGMVNIICLIPAVCFGVAFAAFFFGYRLTPKKMERIAVDLAAREAEKGADGK